jgi:hypothetical protein
MEFQEYYSFVKLLNTFQTWKKGINLMHHNRPDEFAKVWLAKMQAFKSNFLEILENAIFRKF